jgi:hypothetical protein
VEEGGVGWAQKRSEIGVSWSVRLQARAALINTEDGQRQRTMSSLGPGQQGVVHVLARATHPLALFGKAAVRCVPKRNTRRSQTVTGLRDFRRRSLAPIATNPVPKSSIDTGSGVVVIVEVTPASVKGVP